MKKSQYNYFFDYQDKKLAFNSMTCALALVKEDFFYLYNNLDNIGDAELSDEKSKLLSEMKRGGFVIDDSTDEIARIKYRNMNGKFANDHLSLVIAPTLACNFGCPYCYENPKGGQMSAEVQDKLVQIVSEAAERKKNIQITWYGGEPLLAKNVIYALSQRFMEVCDKYGVRYYADIITNGYLIEDSDVDNFKRFKIHGVQITIDGPERVHNSRRFLKADPTKGTFSVIVNNVRKLYDAQIGVALRVNIDKTNIDETKELILYFKSLNLNNLFVSFGHVSAYTDKNVEIKESCLSVAEYSRESLELQEFLHDNGFRASGFPYYPGIKGNYCGADSVNTYVIDHEGYKYKCWNEVGNIDMSVGNILWDYKDYSDEMISREIAYVTWNPFEQEECKKCFLLPICMGGCPYTGKKNGSVLCERWKYNIKDVLIKTYEQKTTNNT